MKSDVVYLRHMLEAIAQIREYTQDINATDFRHTRLLQDGVIRQLGIIGETARHISLETQEARSEIPWADVIGARNVLIHHYVDVDVEEVWKTVVDDLPLLREQVARLLHALADAGDLSRGEAA